MRIFRGRISQRILSLLVLMALITAETYIIGELLTPISYADYFNHDMELIEQKNQHVDSVFIGGSRTYRTFAPKSFEEKIGWNCVVNAGTSQQPLCATYYQLKDLVERVHPEYVILGVTTNRLLGEPTRQGKMLVYDRVSFLTKVEYVLDCFNKDNLPYLFPPYRFRNNLGKLPSVIEKRKTVIENNYQPDEEASEYYVEKGFAYSKRTYETGNVAIEGDVSFSKEAVKEENLKYLDACVALCKEEGIHLYLVTPPTTMMCIYSYPGSQYDEVTQFCKQYAEENHLVYHNLNYLIGREEFLPDERMHDFNHVNGEGAYVVSEIYAEILRKDIAGMDTGDYFYADLGELKADVHRIVAVGAEIEEDEDDYRVMHINISSLQNDTVEPLYKVDISVDGGTSYTGLTEWSAEKEMDIRIENDRPFQIKVRASTGNEGDAEAYQVYYYK